MKIIGFFKEENIDENSLIFYRAVSIITTDREEFNLDRNNDSESDDDKKSCEDYF